MKLQRYIDDLQCRISEEIEDLNYGGCIHFAYYLSKKLKSLKIEHKIALLDHSKTYITKNMFNQRGINHVMIFIPEIGFVDGYKTYEGTPPYYYKNYKQLSFAIRKNRYVWNPTYDITQNPRVRQIIKQVFSNYE